MVSLKIFKSHETLIYFHVCPRQEAENYKDLISKLIPEPLILFNLISFPTIEIRSTSTLI